MEEVNKKYCWNLKDIYAGLDELDKDIESFQKKYENAFDCFVGKMDNKESVLEYFKLMGKYRDDYDKIRTYIGLGSDLDFTNEDLKQREDLLSIFLNDLSVKVTPISTQLSKQSAEFIDDCMKDKRFENYKMKLDGIKLSQSHVLTDKEENIFALMGSFDSGFEDIYENIMNNDMSFKPVIVNGKEEKLTSGNLSMYLKNENRDVRKQAYVNNFDAISKRVNSAVTAYIYKLKLACCDLKLRNYTSMLDAVLESEKIPKEVYYKLIDKVEENIDFTKNFYEIKKKALKFDKFYGYDSSLPLSVKADKKLSIEQQLDIMRNALSVLGEDYIKRIDKAVENNWFDLYQSDTKLDSTFATMSYALKHPYVFMRQRFDLDSLSDLIHEFGHAVNFDMIMEHQTRENSGSPIYCAEIASTTNEILLLDYMYNHTNNIDEKIYYLEKYINDFMGTVITQTQFSQFEDYAHKLVENGEPITVDILCNKWYEISEKYNGGVFDKVDEIKDYKKGQNFIRVHHFMYYTYYVFNYATSYTSAFNIATRILNGDTQMRDKYLEFLGKGSIEYPDEQVKAMGINLETDQPYDLLFSEMKKKMVELDRLLKIREQRNLLENKIVRKPVKKETKKLIELEQ